MELMMSMVVVSGCGWEVEEARRWEYVVYRRKR